MYCPKCKKIFEGNIKYCPDCHSVLAIVITDPTKINRLTPQNEKEKPILFWLTLILPWLGFFLFFTLRDRHSINLKYIIKGFRVWLILAIIFSILVIKNNM